MQNADSNSSAEAKAESEQKAEVTTSSSNNTKPHVVGSQIESVSTEKELLNEKYLKIKDILKGFSITKATEIADYFIRQIRTDTKIP